MKGLYFFQILAKLSGCTSRKSCDRGLASGNTLFSLTSRQNWWGSVVRLMSAVATRAATQ